jgi:IS5 family transposase
LVLPRSNLVSECFLVRNSAVKALCSECAPLDFGHVQPTAVNWREVELEAIQILASLVWREQLVESFWFVGAREATSSYYRKRSDRHIRTLKTMALVDTDSCTILDVHCSAHWPHDTQVGRQVALRNTNEIESLAGDKGYNDQSLRDALC